MSTNIKLRDRNGNDVTYQNIDTVTFDTPTDGVTAVFTHGEAEEKTVPLDMASGDQEVNSSEGKLIRKVTIQRPATLIPGNIAKDIIIAGVTGTFLGADAQLPRLNTPSASRNNDTLSISNPSTNGNFVQGYKIFDGETLKATINSTSYNLINLGLGDYSIQVKAYADKFEDSLASSPVDYGYYSITKNLTDLTSNNSTAAIGIGRSLSMTLAPVAGKYLPTLVGVTMGGSPTSAYTWDNETGAFSIPVVTGDIVITAAASLYARLPATVLSVAAGQASWTAVANATGYKIMDQYQNVLATTANTNYDLTGLTLDDGVYQVTVSATATGYQDSNPSNKCMYVVGANPVYGVSGLYAEDTELTRTDDATALSFAINSSTGAISSDFNSVFPWNEAEIVYDADNNKFLRMPDMYFRVGVDTNGYITDVAVSKLPRDTGNWYMCESFDYGCYGASLSGNVIKSVSGATRLGSKTRANFRSYAAANGAGYFQKDLYHASVMRFLWLIEWATKKSDSIMSGRISGSGTSGGSSLRPTGGTDDVTTPSGFETAYKQMRYHYIEDFVGNQWEFEDGVYSQRSSTTTTQYHDYVTDDPTKFSDSTTGLDALSFATPLASGELAALGWDSDHPFMVRPTLTVDNGNYNTHYCDYVSAGTGTYPVVCCGASCSDSSAYYGLFCTYRNYASGSSAFFGGRLLRKS